MTSAKLQVIETAAWRRREAPFAGASTMATEKTRPYRICDLVEADVELCQRGVALQRARQHLNAHIVEATR